MTNSPDERGLELRELFFETSLELLQALNEEALKLEKTPGDEEIVRGIRDARTERTGAPVRGCPVARKQRHAERRGGNRLCRCGRFYRHDRGIPHRRQAAFHQNSEPEDRASDRAASPGKSSRGQ